MSAQSKRLRSYLRERRFQLSIFKKLMSGGSMDSELQKLHSACQQWGFLQVMNHGVTPLLLEEFKREVIELFKLPIEEKKKLWQQEDSFEGFGSRFVVSGDQKLDWSDMFGVMTLPPHIRKMDLFHKLPSKLRSIEHRAIVNSNKERLSVATFYTFNLDSKLGPAHSLIGPNNPPIFRRVLVQKYLQDFFARKLDGKSYLNFMKVETSDGES